MLQTRDIIWTCLLFGTAAALQVTITPIQGEISVGDSKFFMCEVVGDAKEIDWFSPSGEKILPNRQHITVTSSEDESSTLTIYDANIDDAGVYKCVARNDEGESEATVNVKIYQKLTFKNAPSPQEFNEGDNADIVCDVVSSPPPTVIWKRGSSRIHLDKDVRFKILSNHHLQIRGIKKADEGAYTCEGRIMARGEIDLKVIKVVVNVRPSIRIRQSELNATADIGQSVTLACDADGFPEPKVTWARNNVVLQSDEKYSINEDGSELVIKVVNKGDEGDYKCIATNKAGEKEEEVSLNVFVQPKITYINNQTAQELDEHITLTCEATGDPTPNILWSFGRRVFTEQEQDSWTRPETHKSLDGNVVVRSHARVSSLTLKYVQFTDAGLYTCTARNAIGHDAKAAFLEVRYGPKIQGQISVYTWEGNPANITCEVLAHPGASVVWLRDGLLLPAANVTNIKIYNTPSKSFLEVTPDSQTDFGSYNCTATNAISSESKEFLLIQADVPSSPTIEQVEPYSSTALVRFDEPDANGGVPVLRYKAEWRIQGHGEWSSQEYDAKDGEEENTITITGLKPETSYEVKMSAINGMGEGESSTSEVFKTEPVQYSFTIPPVTSAPVPATTTALREPSPPKLEGKSHPKGNIFKVKWIKQDDGGSPIKHYLVRYKPKHLEEWKPEIRLPSSSEYVVLSGLDWNTEYEVAVVAENQQGKSQPGTFMFRTSAEPTAIPDIIPDGSGLGTGAIVGILIVVFVLLLVGVDITCYFLNKCGLLMCIAVNFCGKAGPGAKNKDIEEGKAAFTKDESKEPIVEVRTEEERTPNHEGVGQTEPNETTPLTEPEPAADSAATVVDLLPSVATNSTTVTDSPASECTTLSSSAAGPPEANTKAPPPSAPQSSTPKSAAPAPSPPTPSEAPLVDLSDSTALPKHPSIPTPDLPPQPAHTTATPTPNNSAESAAKPPQSQDLQIDGSNLQSSNNEISRDVFEPPADSTATPAPAQDEKVVLTEDKSKANEAEEVKKPPSEVQTVPNDAAQTNGNESKA